KSITRGNQSFSNLPFLWPGVFVVNESLTAPQSSITTPVLSRNSARLPARAALRALPQALFLTSDTHWRGCNWLLRRWVDPKPGPREILPVPVRIVSPQDSARLPLCASRNRMGLHRNSNAAPQALRLDHSSWCEDSPMP